MFALESFVSGDNGWYSSDNDVNYFTVLHDLCLKKLCLYLTS